MWPSRKAKVEEINAGLLQFGKSRAMPGISAAKSRETLAWQMVSSIRRLDYTQRRLEREISPHRADPNHVMFDPEAAAIIHARAGHTDEAFWLVFLATHFGKSGATGWQLLQSVYSGLGAGTWTWERVSSDPTSFGDWIEGNRPLLQGRFSNHRKYESLNSGPKGTTAVVLSYLAWVGPARSHAARISGLVREGGNDPHSIFDHFYRTLNVLRFGRLAKFDFLALLGRLQLAPIEPGSAYIRKSSGPRQGARLLFLGDAADNSQDANLDAWVIDLGGALSLGMQVMEDSICNWQKSPSEFKHFRG